MKRQNRRVPCELIETDEDLMEKIRADSKSAFIELVERWQGKLLRFFYLSGIKRDDIDDCLQETFLRLFASRKRYRRNGAPFRSFLYRIAKNTYVDNLRKKRRTGDCISLESGAGLEPFEDDPSPSWRAALDVRAAVLSLPERHRLVVVLNIYEGLAYREVAEALDVPVGTVKSRMYHALLKLREVLCVN